LLDPKLVRRLVQAVLTGVDERNARERRRRDDAKLGGEGRDSGQDQDW
jgi:hypothetical protein